MRTATNTPKREKEVSLFRLFRGALLCAAVLGGVAALPAAPLQGGVIVDCATNRVAQYARLDFTVHVPATYDNPFDPDEVDLQLRLTTPDGGSVSVPAFWCQPYEYRKLPSERGERAWFYPEQSPTWQARFAPLQPGRYLARALLKDKQGTTVSEPVRFECVNVTTPSHGFLRVSPKDPRFLEFADGTPFFAIGQNLAFIGSQQYVSLPKAEEIFGKLQANGANYLRIWTCCDDWAMALEARKSAWGRSWDWRPPIVPAPGGTAKCLKISDQNPTLRAEPSHPVALRPGTMYLLTGKVRAEGDAMLHVEGLAHLPAQVVATNGQGTWAEFRVPFETEKNEFWLNNFAFRSSGSGTCWLSSVSIREAKGGPELLWEADVNRPRRGFYNPLDCRMLDEVVQSAERHGLFLQLCLLTRDLYMHALKDPASEEYRAAIRDARKLLRYAVARWGYSTHVAAWEYWNEMDPGLPTDAFYSALGEYLEQVDVCHHLRTTSTWGPSARDCRHPKLDVADVHFYLRPSDHARLRDEVDAVAERTRWLLEQAPRKPAHLGEFGLADEKWRMTPELRQSPELADIHNALWASGLSGAFGTALFWWWERLDQGGAYAEYRSLSRFLADVPWTTGDLRPAALSMPGERARVLGLQSRDAAWLWLFNPQAAWEKLALEKITPETIAGLEFELTDLPAGAYRVEWWDTREGRIVRRDNEKVRGRSLKLQSPEFQRDVACKVLPE